MSAGAAEAGTAYVNIRGDLSSLSKQLGAALAPGKLGKLGKLGGIGIAAGLTAAVGKGLYDVGKEFDQAFDTIRTGTGKTGKAFKGLQKDLKGTMKGLPVDINDAGVAIAELNTRLDITGKPLRSLSKQMLELSRITGTDVKENVAATARAFGDWEVKTGDQSKTLNYMFKASQASGASVSELGRQVVQFGAPLRQVGFDFEQAVAMFANFEKAGVNTQTMMPGLKFALKKFLKADIDPKKGLAKAFKGIEDGSIKSSEALDLFGQRAGADMVEAVKQGRFHIDSFVKTLEDGDDTILKSAKDTQSFSEKWLIFKNNLKLKIEPAASALFDKIGDGMERVTGILNDPNLTGSQKFDKIMDGMTNQVVQALPKIEHAGIQVGKRLVKGIAKGFTELDIVPQLIIAGLVMKRLGAFRAAGAVAGAEIGAGVAAGAAAGVTGAAGAARLGAGASAAGAGVAGAGAAGGMMAGLKGSIGKMKPLLKKLGWVGVGLTLMDGIKDAFRSENRGVDESIAAFGKSLKESVTFGLVKGQSPEEKRIKGIERIKAAIESSGVISRKNLNAELRAAKWLFNLNDKEIEQLKNKTRRHNENLRLQEQLRSGNLKAVGWQSKLFKNGQIADDQVKKMIESFKKMPPEARNQAKKTVVGMAAAMEKFGKAPKGSAKKLSDDITKAFKNQDKKVFNNFKGIVKAIGGPLASASKGSHKAIKLITGNLKALLLPLNAKIPKFNLTTPAGMMESASSLGSFLGSLGRQRGGMIPGVGDGDRVPVMAEPGEGFINKRAVQALGGPGAINAINASYPRFQKGGMVDPSWDPGNERLSSAISGNVGRWARTYGANMTAGYDPGGGHVSPGHNVTGTATDMVPMGGWNEKATKRFEQGLRVLTGKGIKVLYGTAGIGSAYPNHGRGNHAHIEWGSGSAGGGASFVTKLAKLKLQGPDGTPKDIIQATINRASKAGNAYLSKKFGSLGGGNEGAETGAGSVKGAFNKSLLKNLWRSAGGSKSTANLAAAVALAESGGNPSSVNHNSNGTIDRGLWQINSIHGKLSTLNPLKNAKAAVKLSGGGKNWQPWVAFNSGRHVQFLQGGGIVSKMNSTKRKIRSIKDQLSTKGLSASKKKSLQQKQKGLYGRLSELKRKNRARKAKANKRNKRKTLSKGLSLKRGKELKAADDNIENFSESINVNESLFALPSSEAAEDIGEGELVTLLNLYGDGPAVGKLDWQITKRNIARARLDTAQKRLTSVNHTLKKLRKERPKKGKRGKKQSREAWNNEYQKKLKSWNKRQEWLKENRVRVKELIKDSRDVIIEEEGTTGLGGNIFDTKLSIRELVEKPKSDGDQSGSDQSEKDSLLAELLRQQLEDSRRENAILKAQMPIFERFKNAPPFGGSFADGGIVPGPVGAPRTIVAHGGEAIGQTGDSAPTHVTVVVEDGAVDSDKIRVEVTNTLEDVVRKARSGPAVGRSLVFPGG